LQALGAGETDIVRMVTAFTTTGMTGAAGLKWVQSQWPEGQQSRFLLGAGGFFP
jgi:hypothetical protein